MPTYSNVDSYLKRAEEEALGENGEYTDIDQYFRKATNSNASAGAVSSVSNGANNRIATFASSKTLNGESLLTFDGSKLNVQGGLIHKRRVVTSSTTLSPTDYYIAVKISSTSTVTLPATNTLTAGQTFVIKDESGTLSDSVILNLTAGDGETIEGSSSFSINHSNASIFIYTDGSGKYFIY